jgi:hypothetical protein
MRILVDLKSHLTGATPLITQVEKVPPQGVAGQVAINGKYIIPSIPGTDFRIDSADYVLDGGGAIDGGDVSSIVHAHLLAMFPMFGHVYFNPLLTDDHVAELDLAATWKDASNSPPDPPTIFPTRAQTGRAPGADGGQMPNSTAVLAVNTSVTPNRPGVLVTDLIDISSFTGGVGTDEFMVYWYLYEFDVTQDVAASFGAVAGQNTPAHRNIRETDQEPAGFSAYFSPDDGDNWCEAGLLEPLAFVEKTTSFRVAFVNTSPNKVYLATYAVLF